MVEVQTGPLFNKYIVKYYAYDWRNTEYFVELRVRSDDYFLKANFNEKRNVCTFYYNPVSISQISIGSFSSYSWLDIIGQLYISAIFLLFFKLVATINGITVLLLVFIVSWNIFDSALFWWNMDYGCATAHIKLMTAWMNKRGRKMIWNVMISKCNEETPIEIWKVIFEFADADQNWKHYYLCLNFPTNL